MDRITTDGIVLREVKTGEADRILTLLTRDRGVISAAAKGSRRIKNKLSGPTALLCHSDFTLFRGRTMYTVDDAQVRDSFFALSEKMENLALAMYMTELSAALAPEDNPAGEYLDHLLRGFYILTKASRPPRLVKAAFSLRVMAMAGFMPDLVACDECGKFESPAFYLNVADGLMLCASCAADEGLAPNAYMSTVAAMRHILFSNPEKIYNFTLGEASSLNLDDVCTAFVNYQLEKPLKTEAFLAQALGSAPPGGR